MKTEAPVQIHSRDVAVVNAVVHADSLQPEADSLVWRGFPDMKLPVDSPAR